MNDFHVGWCPYCNQGWIDVVKDTSSNVLLLLCGECDTTWARPEDIEADRPLRFETTGTLEVPLLSDIEHIMWDKWLVSRKNI